MIHTDGEPTIANMPLGEVLGKGGHLADDVAEVALEYTGYPVRLTKAEARFLQKLITMHVDYPELEPWHQELFDRLDAVL